jgi:hypothetical protein
MDQQPCATYCGELYAPESPERTNEKRALLEKWARGDVPKDKYVRLFGNQERAYPALD